ncbi:MAG: bifunctional 4-hydroxy-2-oxoglutarate aldolase/2-dehydro-3-deoxy-phosphogluconate aldolase [Verrucomicrobiota bacterium]
MNSQFPPALLNRIESAAVIAVVTIDDAATAPALADALLAGGIDAMELTLRTPTALDALSAIRNSCPDMLVGAGTILTPDQVDQANDAGAAFGVAPGLNPRVVQAAQSKNLPFAPGVTTPSEIEQAIELGCCELKFFPAESSGGLPYLSNIAAPFAHLDIRFIPLGGINSDNMSAYLNHEAVLAIGGSWLAPSEQILSQDWPAITARAQSTREIIFSIRSNQLQ